jgi:hypothetical protein
LPSSVDAVCANPIAPNNSVAPALASTFLVHLDLIDTTPPVNEKAHGREGTSIASFGTF